MSNTSTAFFAGVVEGSMRNAVPILFWVALALFALTLASNGTFFFRPEIDQTETPTRVFTILEVLVIGLNNAAWPFTGAALVWTLQNRPKEAAE